MVIFDANMILRYLLNDNTEMADQAEKLLEENNVNITIEVVAEVVYVLKGVYNLTRQEISYNLSEFLQLVGSRDMEILGLAIKIFGSENIDFVDCILYAYNQLDGAYIATYDKKLLRLLDE